MIVLRGACSSERNKPPASHARRSPIQYGEPSHFAFLLSDVVHVSNFAQFRIPCDEYRVRCSMWEQPRPR